MRSSQFETNFQSNHTATPKGRKCCVANVSSCVNAEMLRNHFQECGTVNNIRFFRPQDSSKNGHAVVHFATGEGSKKAQTEKHCTMLGGEVIHVHAKRMKGSAVGCSHFPLQLNCVYVQFSSSAWSSSSSPSSFHGRHSAPPTRHQQQLARMEHQHLSEHQLYELFQPFGFVSSVCLPRFNNGTPKNYCFVYFRSHTGCGTDSDVDSNSNSDSNSDSASGSGFLSAKKAIKALHGSRLGNLRLRCCLARKYGAKRRRENRTAQNNGVPSFADLYRVKHRERLQTLETALNDRADLIMDTFGLKQEKALFTARRLHWIESQVDLYGENMARNAQTALSALSGSKIYIPEPPSPHIFKPHAPFEKCLNAATKSIIFNRFLRKQVRKAATPGPRTVLHTGIDLPLSRLLECPQNE